MPTIYCENHHLFFCFFKRFLQPCLDFSSQGFPHTHKKREREKKEETLKPTSAKDPMHYTHPHLSLTL